MSVTATLDALLDPIALSLDKDAARKVIEHQIPPEVQDRLDDLADRCTEGLLTPAERNEYEARINAVDFISILKLKARRKLLSTEGCDN